MQRLAVQGWSCGGSAVPVALAQLMGCVPLHCPFTVPIASSAGTGQSFHTSAQACGKADSRTRRGKIWLGTYGKSRPTPRDFLHTRPWCKVPDLSQVNFKLPPGPSMAPSRPPYVTPPGWEDEAKAYREISAM